MKIKEALLKAADILYPRVCPVCRDILTPAFMAGQKAAGNNPFICGGCMSRLIFTSKFPCCLLCGKPLSDEYQACCETCSRKGRSFDRCVSLLAHEDYARIIIYGLKYHGLRDNADFIAWEMVNRYGNLISAFRPDAFIPVPLHKTRRLERGFNQAELISRKICFYMEEKGLGRFCTDPDYLLRTAKTSPLKEMSVAQRNAAISGAFSVEGPLGKYSRIILVDDIFTTGTTLNECSRILKDAGVKKILCLTGSTVA